MSTTKMHSVRDLLQRFMFAKNFRTWKELAADIGESGSTISAWKSRNSQSVVPKLLCLSREAGISERWLLTGEGPMQDPGAMSATLTGKGALAVNPPEPSNVEPHYDRLPVRKVPLISWVQAGGFIDPNCQTTPGYAEHYEETAATSSDKAFALTVKGDSMEPEFTQGDIIIVDPERGVNNGSFIIAKNGDGEATFKQLVQDGSRVLFKPLNQRYPIMDMTGVKHNIVGVVVEKKKRY